ncbi:unnamed protein product [Lactuca saligna]|uniref:Uncharacterized protein n=1 Tax=Lactuca saligna TaxID=75948 RepID=A0AA36A636_LACSI|nr:unnamed protein product [Lactuca saligna]
MDDDFVRDARKGKAKLEEEDPDPKPNPYALLPVPITKSYSNLGEDVVYLKLFGPPRNYAEIAMDTPEAVKKIQFRFREKEFNRILGKGDTRIINIQCVSGATIGILSDTAAKIHRHLYLELLGTADQIKTAELLITDVITEGYEKPFFTRALMPANIFHYRTPIFVTQVVAFLGFNNSNVLKMESESNTWIEVDTYPPEGLIMMRMVNMYGQRLDVANAIMMINAWVDEYEFGKRKEDGKQKDVDEDDSGIKEGGDEVGNEAEG